MSTRTTPLQFANRLVDELKTIQTIPFDTVERLCLQVLNAEKSEDHDAVRAVIPQLRDLILVHKPQKVTPLEVASNFADSTYLPYQERKRFQMEVAFAKKNKDHERARVLIAEMRPIIEKIRERATEIESMRNVHYAEARRMALREWATPQPKPIKQGLKGTSLKKGIQSPGRKTSNGGINPQ